MRQPTQLRVPLSPSRTWTVAIPAIALAACAAWWSIGAPWWSDLGVALVVSMWMLDRVRLHGWRCARASVTEVLASTNRIVVMRHRDGRLVAGHVRSASFVHPWLTTIVWRPDGARFSRSLPIVADMLDADDFRRLRVLLRYGSSEVSDGSPASQA